MRSRGALVYRKRASGESASSSLARPATRRPRACIRRRGAATRRDAGIIPSPEGENTPSGERTTQRGHPWTTEGGAIPGTTRRDVSNVAAKLARRTTAPEWKAPQRSRATRRQSLHYRVRGARHGRFHGLHFGVGCCAKGPQQPPAAAAAVSRANFASSLAKLRKLDELERGCYYLSAELNSSLCVWITGQSAGFRPIDAGALVCWPLRFISIHISQMIADSPRVSARHYRRCRELRGEGRSDPFGDNSARRIEPG